MKRNVKQNLLNYLVGDFRYSEYNISVSEERFGELLRYLGLLYDQSEQVNSEAVIRELDEVLTSANISLNITEVMEKVSPVVYKSRPSYAQKSHIKGEPRLLILTAQSSNASHWTQQSKVYVGEVYS